MIRFVSSFVCNHVVLDYDKVEQIQKTRLEARQYVSEKVAVAEQAYASVDSVIKKLDVDLAAFESYVPLRCRLQL